MGNPAQIQLGLHSIRYFYFSLSTDGQHVAVAEVKTVMTDTDQLVLFSLEKEFFLEDVGVLSDLEVGLVEIFFAVAFFSPSLSQLQQ